MSTGKGLWFVYRSPCDGPLSKRVCRIECASILTWFQEKIADARASSQPRQVADEDLGGPVAGFGSFLAAAKEHKLAAPKSMTALRALLQRHLVAQADARPRAGFDPKAGPVAIRLDDHTLRVLTGEGDQALAFYFFDDDAVRDHGDAVAWLLEEDPALVDGEEDGSFEPAVPLPALSPAGRSEGATYACIFTCRARGALPGSAAVLPGVRLPRLATHLRSVVPAHAGDGAWPMELRLLRAMVHGEETALAPALERCAAYPLFEVALAGEPTPLGSGAHASAIGEFLAAAEGKKPKGDPEKHIVHEGEHVAVLSAHASRALGHQQWILFDDRWAAAYPDLAQSLLRYAIDWDPFQRPAADADPAASVAPSSHEHAWRTAVAQAAALRAPEGARRYRPAERFAAGELVEHAKFGLGVVKRVEATKIEVVFRDAARTLAHGAG